ncbi:MAG: radical SAM protein [Polyangiales bacterium]
MEPDRQIEIQLGHMCNNRCVFCVSGQRTELREAFPIAAAPVVEKLREARASGIEKVTLLGGEPTIQPEFFAVLRAAVELGFHEIVIFTNGVKTARGTFVDEVLATGGNFTWRLSFQGGDARAHDRTTKKLGSFLRLVETLQNLHARRQRITVNMCVVRSNFESVDKFPALLMKYGVTQLHLDMIRPLDAGERTEDEMRAMLPRYGDMVPALERMIAGFPPGFDVNIGNLPYCIAPQLAPHIHHDGNPTLTVAIDRDSELSEAWDKYAVKRRDKVKVEACRTCAFDDRCSGIFDTYGRFYGIDELRPLERKHLPVEVSPEASLDPRIGRCLARLRSGAPFPELTWHDTRIEGDGRAATVELRHDGGVGVTLTFAVHGEGVRGGYKLDRQVEAPPAGLVEGVRAAMSALRGDTLAK